MKALLFWEKLIAYHKTGWQNRIELVDGLYKNQYANEWVECTETTGSLQPVH